MHILDIDETRIRVAVDALSTWTAQESKQGHSCL